MVRISCLVLVLMTFPTTALAAGGSSDNPPDQIWALIVGTLVPLVTYIINKFAPWTKESVKATVLLIASAVVGGLAQAITSGDVGFNKKTLSFITAAIFAAFSAHHGVWKPSGISRHLRGVQDTTKMAPPV